MRTKAMLLGALCLLLVGGLILGGAGAAAQGSEPMPILIQVGGYLTGVSVEDGKILWFFTGQGVLTPFGVHHAMVGPDRASLLLDTRAGPDDMRLYRIELPLHIRSLDDFHDVAYLSNELYRNRPETITYVLSPEQDMLVGVARRQLAVVSIEDDLPDERRTYFLPLETWILPDQEISDAEIVIDPLARHAYVRVDLVSGAYGYDDYAALWVDLAALTTEPVETDAAWASWSEDGAYLATFSPDEGLAVRDGGTLEVFPWSADLIAPREAHNFTWGTDGETAYYFVGDAHGPRLIRLDLTSGESRPLMEDPPLYGPVYERPTLYLGNGGSTALIERIAAMDMNFITWIDLETGEPADYSNLLWETWDNLEIFVSPTRDFFLMFNSNGYESSCEFHAWREGIELAGRWDGPVALYGWTPEGLPILQTLSFEDVPEDYSRYPSDRTTSVPDPGWYVFDIAEDGTALWTPLPCPDCRVIPAGFPEVQLSVQRPDGAPVFAVVGTGDAGPGVYVVDLVAGTTKLVFAQEPERVTQIDWLAPGSLPLESAPHPTEDPNGPHG